MPVFYCSTYKHRRETRHQTIAGEPQHILLIFLSSASQPWSSILLQHHTREPSSVYNQGPQSLQKSRKWLLVQRHASTTSPANVSRCSHPIPRSSTPQYLTCRPWHFLKTYIAFPSRPWYKEEGGRQPEHFKMVVRTDLEHHIHNVVLPPCTDFTFPLQHSWLTQSSLVVETPGM